MEIGVSEGPTKWFKSFRIEHSGFDKVFKDKLDNFISFIDGDFKIKPLKMSFCIGIRFHE